LTTYKGWPLYYYAGDASPGDVNGDGLNNLWFVAKPDYSLMVANGQLVGADGKMYTSDYMEGTGITVYFTDINGRTLYIFVNDEKDTNNYTNPDFSNNSTWPIFYVDIEMLPSGMDPADFGQIDVFGEPQLTFRGWPLYYFGSDAQRGETKGVSVPVPGIWPVVNNDTDPAM
jgi:predicted lipoprotein with Yx(FWY)xxD motif